MKSLILCFLFLLSPLHLTAFSIENAIVPQEEILSGGPPKDGIPALLNPTFFSQKDVTFLQENDKVIGVTIAGESKAYPIKILNWHEAVNDTLGGQDIVVTF
jgi:hypothetical protein